MATFIGASSQSFSGAGTSTNIAVPAGTVDGSGMYLFMQFLLSPGTISPAGWSLVAQPQTSNSFLFVWQRDASSEPASYTINWSSSNAGQSLAAGIISYALGGPTPHYAAQTSTASGASGTTSLSTPGDFALFTTPNMFRLVFAGSGSGAAITPPANVAERAQVTTGGAARVYVFEDQRTVDDGRLRATDTLTFTYGSVVTRSIATAFLYDGARDTAMDDRFLVTAPPRILFI